MNYPKLVTSSSWIFGFSGAQSSSFPPSWSSHLLTPFQEESKYYLLKHFSTNYSLQNEDRNSLFSFWKGEKFCSCYFKVIFFCISTMSNLSLHLQAHCPHEEINRKKHNSCGDKSVRHAHRREEELRVDHAPGCQEDQQRRQQCKEHQKEQHEELEHRSFHRRLQVVCSKSRGKLDYRTHTTTTT